MEGSGGSMPLDHHHRIPLLTLDALPYKADTGTLAGWNL